MALYEDGGVSFAQEQFEQARKRREKEAKKQEKFAKRLQLANLAITGANFVLNQKADKLEREGYVNRSHYLTQNENSKGWQDMYQGYQDLGYTNQQMLEAETKKQLESYIQAQVGEDKDIRQFNDAINDISNRFSSDVGNLESWNKVIETQLAIPKLSEADLLELIKKDGAAPRSVAGWFGNKVLKVAKSHDEDTLSEEDKLAKKKILGGLVGKRFEDSKVALQEWADKGNPIGEFKEFLLSEEGKKLTAFSDLKTAVVRDSDRYGRPREYLVSTAIDENGQSIQIGKPVLVSQDSSIPEVKRTAVEFAVARDKITSFVKRANEDDLDKSFKDIYLKNPDGYTDDILDTMDALKFNYGMSESLSQELAVRHILNQAGMGETSLDTNLSLFDIDKLKDNIDTENIKKYADNILDVKDSFMQQSELREMRDFIQETILSDENVSEDTKQEDLLELDKIMSDYRVIPSKDYNNIVIDKREDSEEVKNELKELNNISFGGKVKDFMFGPEIDAWDLTWLVPGYGALKVTGKLTTKFAVPKVADGLLKSKAGKAAIAKVGARMQKTFKTDEMRDRYIKSLNPFEKAIYNSLSKSGKSVNKEVFISELARMPGLYIKGFLPTIGRTVGWGLGGSLFAYGQYQSRVVEDKNKTDD